jgi:hypothetical protein
MPFSDKALESGRNDTHGIEWAVYQDLDVDPDDHKEFTIIGSRGTGKYIQPDVTCDSMDEFQAELDSGKYVMSLPLYMLAHGVVRLSTGSFSDPWDSGQCGFAALTKEQALDVTDKEDLESMLASAVKTFDSAMNGNVVGYVITRKVKCATCENESETHLESCWGFVLSGWGGMDGFLMEEVYQQFNYWVDHFSQQEHAATSTAKSDD